MIRKPQPQAKINEETFLKRAQKFFEGILGQ